MDCATAALLRCRRCGAHLWPSSATPTSASRCCSTALTGTRHGVQLSRHHGRGVARHATLRTARPCCSTPWRARPALAQRRRARHHARAPPMRTCARGIQGRRRQEPAPHAQPHRAAGRTRVPMVMALNMTDEAKARGVTVDAEALSEALWRAGGGDGGDRRGRSLRSSKRCSVRRCRAPLLRYDPVLERDIARVK